jgi:hypothetical protein
MTIQTAADVDREWRMVWGNLLLLTAMFTLILVVGLTFSAW